MVLNSESSLALRGLFLISLFSAVHARRWTVNNDCSYTVWPAIYSPNTTVTLSGVETGWQADPGSSRSFVVPEGWTNGHIWARRNCDFSSGNTPADTNTTVGGCVSGGCQGGLYCTGLGTAPITGAEWTLAPGDGSGADYYDVSVVSGFNVPLQVLPSAMGCGVAECVADLNSNCPEALRGPFSPSDNTTIGCKSACTANIGGNPNNSASCCTGQFSVAGACPSSGVEYYDFFKNACPFTYAYSQDYPSGTALQMCPGSSYADYTVTFCPPTKLASASATQSMPMTSGTITGIPTESASVTGTFSSSASLQTSLIPSNANSASTIPITCLTIAFGAIVSTLGAML
ncbi:pathogenesis-related protein PR5K (thaumatin family) [Ceratobasidium sp. AG-Ba]|nr:pathogenesis-related protein PR5K (thaumatin family) [Ceratobasidium sp. AG-Ba]